jgi:hypothetical protein
MYNMHVFVLIGRFSPGAVLCASLVWRLVAGVVFARIMVLAVHSSLFGVDALLFQSSGKLSVDISGGECCVILCAVL